MQVWLISTLIGGSVLTGMPLLTAAESSSPTWTTPDFFGSDGTSLATYRVSDEVWLSDSVVVGSVKPLIAKGEPALKGRPT
ncbi:MAG TPA: hypothetical protein VH679_15500 [Vicinamibacterales bacterium]